MDEKIAIAVNSLKEVIERQWDKIDEVTHHIDKVDQKVELRHESLLKQNAEVRDDMRQIRDHVMQFHMVPKTEIKNMSPDYRQYADHGGSNTHNSTQMVKWGIGGAALIVIVVLAFSIGGKIEAGHDATRLKIESVEVAE
ncbi:hypothetical protein [Kordiimonas sp.]|uniref:hypothetical protein n=1 Tax=Kordiimonas sp. TaxID=1970157 RepID=UPI003A908366